MYYQTKTYLKEKFKIAIFVFLLLAGVDTIQAQDEENKWVLGFGINIVDLNNGGFSDIGELFKDYAGSGDWNTIPAISTISVSRYMNYGLSVGIAGSLNKVETVNAKDDVD